MNILKIEVDVQTYELREGTFRIEEDGTIVLKSKEEIKKAENPFEEVEEGKSFYFIGGNGTLMTCNNYSWYQPEMYYDCANYCSDTELLTRRALYEKLERCLWRFSMENGGSGNYYPILNSLNFEWIPAKARALRFGPSFKDKETCERAIEEVIEPMMKGITTDEIFVWKGV